MGDFFFLRGGGRNWVNGKKEKESETRMLVKKTETEGGISGGG